MRQIDPRVRRRRSAAALAAATALSACSLLPDREWPAFELHEVVAVYSHVDAPIEVPVSGENLTVLSLEVDPPPLGERWEQGRRLVLPAPGPRVTITCRYRAYLRDGQVPPPEQLFPGAAVADQQP